MITDILGTTYGDANLDRQFDSSDLVQVFGQGEYEDSIEHNSVWSSGDWNCDGDFESSDLIRALQAGGYSRDANKASAMNVDGGGPSDSGSASDLGVAEHDEVTGERHLREMPMITRPHKVAWHMTGSIARFSDQKLVATARRRSLDVNQREHRRRTVRIARGDKTAWYENLDGKGMFGQCRYNSPQKCAQVEWMSVPGRRLGVVADDG